MSSPIVFISHNRVLKGQGEALLASTREGIAEMERDKPRTVGFLLYLNEDKTELSIVHVFPDATAMDLHMEGVAERVKKSEAYMAPISMELYGTPSPAVTAMFKGLAAAGRPIRFDPNGLGGVLRLNGKT